MWKAVAGLDKGIVSQVIPPRHISVGGVLDRRTAGKAKQTDCKEKNEFFAGIDSAHDSETHDSGRSRPAADAMSDNLLLSSASSS